MNKKMKILVRQTCHLLVNLFDIAKMNWKKEQLVRYRQHFSLDLFSLYSEMILGEKGYQLGFITGRYQNKIYR